MVESMRRQKPNFTEVSRPAQATDRVMVDYDGSIEGKPFEGGVGRDVYFIVGSGRVLTELDAAVVGASAGDTRTVQVSYPQNHASKELAGRTAQFALTVKKVEEMSLSQVDEEFCRAYGVEEGGVEALRAEVRKSMERELAGVVRNRLSGQVMDALYRDYPLDVPRSLVEDAIQRLQIETAQRLGIREASQLPPRETFEPPARRRVALGMIIGEIVRAEKLTVDRGKVQERLEDLIASYPNAEEARSAYLSNADAMRQIESAVMEDQVVDLVLARARVSDRPATFKELTGFGEESERT
jgi:trigger factor